MLSEPSSPIDAALLKTKRQRQRQLRYGLLPAALDGLSQAALDGLSQDSTGCCRRRWSATESTRAAWHATLQSSAAGGTAVAVDGMADKSPELRKQSSHGSSVDTNCDNLTSSTTRVISGSTIGSQDSSQQLIFRDPSTADATQDAPQMSPKLTPQMPPNLGWCTILAHALYGLAQLASAVIMLAASLHVDYMWCQLAIAAITQLVCGLWWFLGFCPKRHKRCMKELYRMMAGSMEACGSWLGGSSSRAETIHQQIGDKMAIGPATIGSAVLSRAGLELHPDRAQDDV